MKTHYDYGLSKIYELVINANPSYAFLLDSNTLLANKFVVAHVFGHSDFFKHNVWFSQTNREMLETVSEHARRIRHYSQDEGTAEVERFLDAVLSISHHVDPSTRGRKAQSAEEAAPGDRAAAQRSPQPWGDLFPPDRAGRRPAKNRQLSRRRIPPEPEQDLLRFFMQHAPHLAEWQQDILAIVREESLYFVPQMQTKIMNEGWPCLRFRTTAADNGVAGQHVYA